MSPVPGGELGFQIGPLANRMDNSERTFDNKGKEDPRLHLVLAEILVVEIFQEALQLFVVDSFFGGVGASR